MKRLLIVDDIPEYVNSLKNALMNDFDIVSAYNLKEAKEKTTKDIDVFLVDIRLDEADPDNYDGIIYLEWVKIKFPEKPVVISSGYVDYDKKDEIIKKGASGFLKKPIVLTDLRAKLKDLVK